MEKHSSIYTKNGDQGNTGSWMGESVSKADWRIELQGAVDEVNAAVGHLRSLAGKEGESLKEIQYACFRIGTDISGNFRQVSITPEDTRALEEAIDRMESGTGPLRSFLYYGGGPAATYAQVVRSIVRRAERVFVHLVLDKGLDYPEDYRYVNRLADYFFAYARHLNHLDGVPEEEMHLKRP
ncbi:cob(I)yrinic acid a,c-diamide adenosyltransferase [Anaerotalea alkaliphila]|uniref:Corrinoid adenosyltransferase n=1 Tax=Anaerotalea alkaliphila TaxID=2662126 RepID=A0A7X5HXD6_9FIRM|nr:cob(I)yrinic acid a,c-diamide adenosyltransferase [Anaerotalea alkaliphila]NDL68392.1 cob(I)yrinic acid a,c-diamide adenosyltransferase [Anaerotalea alkaliphila]